MTVRPIFHENRLRLICSAAALMLAMMAILLAAGCVGENQGLPPGKYIVLKHDIRTNGTTLSGDCSPAAYAAPPPLNFDEEAGTLSIYASSNFGINELLILYYINGTSESSSERTRLKAFANPVYGIPVTFGDNLTIKAISPEGNVTLNYQNNTITLKPKERWFVNTTPYVRHGYPGGNPDKCTEEIVIIDSIYNAGLFDKEKIKKQ